MGYKNTRFNFTVAKNMPELVSGDEDRYNYLIKRLVQNSYER
jgi:hypothetical protein